MSALEKNIMKNIKNIKNAIKENTLYAKNSTMFLVGNVFSVIALFSMMNPRT